MDRDREARIRERAHEIWVREGRQEGSHEDHWQRAERELAAESEAAAQADGQPQQEADAPPSKKRASSRKR